MARPRRPLRFLLAPNDFKGSLSASAAARAMSRGIRAALPGARCELLPLSDGGPGLLAALLSAAGGRLRTIWDRGPLARRVAARWLLLPARRAVIESAQAIGLTLVPPTKRDALRADTFGLGQLLLAAKRAGMREAWVGLGGSATTDGGTGMARALGWRFLDAGGRELSPGGGSLADLARIVRPRRSALAGLKIRVLCDVSNPLLGHRGAARVYAPQKGASGPQVRRLDLGLRRLAGHFRPSAARRPGAGAAGGLGFGLAVFAGARLVPGAAEVFKLSRFQARLRACDVVLSGEGRLDAQSLSGKLPVAVARAARRAGKPCWLIAGSVQGGAAGWRKAGAARVASLRRRGLGAAEAMRRAAQLLQERTRSLALELGAERAR